ncbi:sigma-70 family RNA polymerase sigma factor [Botrimarina hoheduenensis]|uniref:sigma-70 family RNA polymerase sigma factor n=1 Tax=Botrimarina hoheduenensis TaxID=2528000 RepID=UPI001E53FE88|nr:sigma-70 family RNA polymerase sigma factor [Botrimarina hoheduenensis]
MSRTDPPSAAPTASDDRAIDDRLIDRTLAGDSAAFGELVRRHQDRLRGALLRVTGSAEEAEDAAQEAFIQAYLKLSTFQRSAKFYTWLYRVAFNLAISKNRKWRPRVSLTTVQDAGGPEPTATTDSPETPLHETERSEQLHAAIAELADDHREVLVLREFEDMDYQQIAEVLGVPVGTVRSRLFRARAQLRDRLGPLIDDDSTASE